MEAGLGWALREKWGWCAIAGLFVGGDLRAQRPGQGTTGSGDATTAAIAADKYITRFKETERDRPEEAIREAVESSHTSGGGYT